MSVRSAWPNAVGSRVAILLPDWTAGSPLGIATLLIVLMMPVKLIKFGRSTANIFDNDDTRLVIAAAPTRFNVSAPPPMSTAPIIFDPGNSVRVSACGPNLIAVPPVPSIVPELVTVLALAARTPMLPVIVPELE